MNDFMPEKTMMVGITETEENPAQTAKLTTLPTLIVLVGRETGQVVKINQESMTIGRGEDATYAANDPSVSRLHARIDVKGRIYTITDLQSTNGTFVNGQRVTTAQLKEGDKVRLGTSFTVKFTFQDELDSQMQRHLYESATLDFLTQVHNKRYFLDQLSTEFLYAKRQKSVFSLAIMDVDFFKKINDTMGHPAGDYVLKTLAGGIRKAIRKEDVFARYGGEEFVALLRNINEQQGLLFGDRMRQAIAKGQFVFKDQPIAVTISMGVATHNGSTQYADPDAMIQAADDFLYMAKRSGRNQVRCSLNRVEIPPTTMAEGEHR